MPREYVHWLVLETAADKALAEGLLAVDKCLKENKSAAFLGALGQDAPYFLDYGRDGKAQEFADRLHGVWGEEPLSPIRTILNYSMTVSEERERALLAAFGIGMLTHYTTDAVFHPLVSYLTGNYFDPDIQKRHDARTLHRRFETYLDSWFKIKVPSPAPKYVRQSLRGLGQEAGRLMKALDACLPLDADTENAAWEDAYRALSFSQSAFLNPFYGLPMRAARIVFPIQLDQTDALFSFGRTQGLSLFDSEIDYRNPLSGDVIRENLLQIKGRAEREALRLFQGVNRFLETGQGDPFPGEVGLSMETGARGTTPRDYKFFAEKEVIKDIFDL